MGAVLESKDTQEKEKRAKRNSGDAQEAQGGHRHNDPWFRKDRREKSRDKDTRMRMNKMRQTGLE